MSCRISSSARLRVENDRGETETVPGAAVFRLVERAPVAIAVLQVGGRFGVPGIAGGQAQARSDSEVPGLGDGVMTVSDPNVGGAIQGRLGSASAVVAWWQKRRSSN